MTRLASALCGAREPLGYVSFLSALVFHEVLIDGLAVIQVASLDRAGSELVAEGRIEYALLPRDLWFGWAEASFEGARVPVAGPEKALLDWCWLAEERGLALRLDEMDWDILDLAVLDRLSEETGLFPRTLLGQDRGSHHDQDLSRAGVLARLR